MRLLLVIDGISPRLGGPPRVVIGSGLALAKLGHSVTILSSILPKDLDDVGHHTREALLAGIEFVFVKPISAFNIFLPPRQGKIANAVRNADIVHCHGIWSALFLTVGRLADSFSTPYFVSIHGLLSPWAIRQSHLKKQLAIKLFDVKRYLRNARAVIFGSRGEHMSGVSITASLTPEYIPNGVSDQIGPAPVTEQHLAVLHRIVPGVAGWDKTILFYSRIHPKKGLDMLIEAFSSIADQFPGAGLLIAGLSEDDVYRQAIELQISQSSHKDRISLTTELTGEESHFLYGVADIFALPSHDEGFSMALLEAMAYGCPTLSTHLCHCPEIADTGAGVVVDATPAAIAGGLSELLGLNAEARNLMRSNALALFKSKFTWNSVAAQLEACYAKGMTS